MSQNTTKKYPSKRYDKDSPEWKLWAELDAHKRAIQINKNFADEWLEKSEKSREMYENFKAALLKLDPEFNEDDYY